MSDEKFDPSRYLTKIGPADYLEVKWRLLWLRTDHPDASVTTELLSRTQDEAVVSACVSIPNGGTGTGIGTETRADFREFTEKAETKAIGRALAALGYGTQFCADHEFEQGTDGRKVVDSPVNRRNGAGATQRPAQGYQNGNGGGQPGEAITDRQAKFIRDIAREHGMSEEQLTQELEAMFGHGISGMTRREGSSVIETLKSRRPPVELAS